MALSPAVQDARHSGQSITWEDEEGNPQDLTNATLTGTIKPPVGPSRAIDGILALADAPNGVFTWQYGALDVGTAGRHRVQFIATYPDTLNDKTFVTDFIIKESL